MLQNNNWVNNKIKEEIKIYWDKWKWKQNNPKSIGHNKSSPKRKLHNNTGLFWETRKPQMHNLNFHLKELEKEQQIKTEVNRRKEIIKIILGINKIEPKNRKG